MADIDRGAFGSRGHKGPKLLRVAMVTLIIAFLFVSSLSLLPNPSSENPLAPVPAKISYTSHAPISINGNAEFNKTNFPLNGVASGNGTASNPYIIEGWDINASTSIGIRVYNANVHFIIRNCDVHDGSVIYSGIDLVSCSNVSLISNNCSKNENGLSLRLCSNGLLLDNMLRLNFGRGAYLNHSSHFIVSNNTCSNSYQGITLDRSDNITIRNNTCRMMNNYGIYLERSNRVKLIGNNCSGNDYGIYVDWSKNCSISFNNCSENGLGVYLYLSGNSNVTASNNTISENTFYGMYIIFSRDNIFTNNTVALNNIYGICIMFSINNTFSYNLVAYTTGVGMYLDSFSSYNRIWNNTLINNNGASSVYNTSHIQAYDDGTNNRWNTSGTPHGYGNNWSDWRAPDDDWDGIVDNSYNISGSAGAKDYYPLTVPGTPIPEFSEMVVPIVGLMLIALIFSRARKKP